MHAFRCYIFAARIACDSGPTCLIFFYLPACVVRTGQTALQRILSALEVNRDSIITPRLHHHICAESTIPSDRLPMHDKPVIVK